jgi:hypothetical protein
MNETFGCFVFGDFWLLMQAVGLWRLLMAFGTSMYEYVCVMTTLQDTSEVLSSMRPCYFCMSLRQHLRLVSLMSYHVAANNKATRSVSLSSS